MFPKRYFEALKLAFGDACEVLTVLDGRRRPVTSVMSFFFRDRVLPYYGGGTEDAREVAGNDLMYAEVMRQAVRERGCRTFDFGRSKRGTGAFEFERHWGVEPEPLTYSFGFPRGGGELPALNPSNPKFRAFIELWRRLPLPVTKRRRSTPRCSSPVPRPSCSSGWRPRSRAASPTSASPPAARRTTIPAEPEAALRDLLTNMEPLGPWLAGAAG